MGSGFETAFPVVFFDGKATMDMGVIFISPCLNYKAFQLLLSQKIGVSPNQITTYYERSPLNSSAGMFAGGNRRSPVTSKFNFASILCDRDCFFFVVLKRSRRARQRQKKQSLLNYSVNGDTNSADRFDYWYGSPNTPFIGTNYSNYAAHDYVDHSHRRLLERERERCLISQNLNSTVYSALGPLSRIRIRDSTWMMSSDDGGSSSGGASSSGPACEVCIGSKREGETAPFHLCTLDPTLPKFFRTPFGPIARPTRNRA